MEREKVAQKLLSQSRISILQLSHTVYPHHLSISKSEKKDKKPSHQEGKMDNNSELYRHTHAHTHTSEWTSALLSTRQAHFQWRVYIRSDVSKFTVNDPKQSYQYNMHSWTQGLLSCLLYCCGFSFKGLHVLTSLAKLLLTAWKLTTCSKHQTVSWNLQSSLTCNYHKTKRKHDIWS